MKSNQAKQPVTNNKPIQNSNKKVSKSPYNPPPAKLRAQIIPAKIIQANKKKQISSSQSSSDSSQSSDDSEVQNFANQFYDSKVKKADQQLHSKKDNQLKTSDQDKKIQDNQSITKKNLSQYEKVALRLQQVKGRFDNLDMDLVLCKKPDKSKLQEIAQFLSKKHKQKHQFKKKLKKIKKSQKQRKKIQQQIRLKKQNQQHLNRLKQIRKLSQQIKQKVQKKKQQQQENLQKVEQFYEKFHKKHTNRKLYKLMELNDKQKRSKQADRQNQYLKQRRNAVSQLIRSQQLNQFSRRQSQLLRDLNKIKESQKDQRQNSLIQKNRQMRQKIYISNRYHQVIQQQMRKQKEKSVPQQKLKKIKKFDSYVKQNFLPKKQENQENQNQNHAEDQNQDNIVEIKGKLYRKVKQIKYLKGEKIGEVICNVPLPKSQKEIKMVGNSYLQQLKLLPKKRHLSASLESHQVQKQKPKIVSSRVQIPKLPKQIGKINLSKNPNRQQVQNLINSLKARDSLIQNKQHYLKMVGNGKLGAGINPEDKQALDQTLLDNIQKKINLLGRL